MTDFTVDTVVPTHISSYTRYSNIPAYHLSAASGGPISNTWGAASTAVFIPTFLPFPYLAQRAFWVNGGTVATNADIGIYTLGGAKLWSAGSTVQAGTNLPQYVTISPALLLSPGQYYLAWATSGTTGGFFGSIPGSAAVARMAGLVQQATALPLPSPATFASIVTPAGYPLIGLTNTVSGF